MANRKLDDWLLSYLEYTDNSESPITYHTWAGISCISSVFQRKTYMRWGHSTIYPNMYIVLVGPSGYGRKGEPIDIARWILEELNIFIVEEDITQEALIKEIKGAEISFMDESTGAMKFQSAVTACAEELSVFTGYQNPTFLAYLTNWYDSRDKWTRRTKHQGTEEIYGICFNLLCSTAPDWFSHIFTRESIGGGFTSRCIFVVEYGKRQTIANPNLHKPSKSLRNKLIHDLEMIQCLSGEFTFTKEAQEKYEEWYTKEDLKLRSGVILLGEPALQGYASRRATHIKKIAMCLSASKGDSLVIDLSIFNSALELLIRTEHNMPGVFSGFGKSRYVEETNKILGYIKKRGTIKRSQLMSIFYRDVDETSFESIITVLDQMKQIKIKILTGSDDRSYTYIGDD